MVDFPRDKPHILVNDGGRHDRYRRPRLGIDPPALPSRDRARHAAALDRAITRALASVQLEREARDPEILGDRPGFYLEIKVPADHKAVLDNLGDRRQNIELLTVRQGQDRNTLLASVFVPDRAENVYLEKVRAYRDNDTKGGDR